MKKIVAFVLALQLALVFMLSVYALEGGQELSVQERYAQAEALFNQGQYEEMMALLEALAAEDYADAYAALGRRYVVGDAVAKDAEKAKSLLEKGIALGSVKAMFNMGYGYSSGALTADGQPDDAMACQYYELAAQAGHAPAMNNLAIRLKNGQGVEKNLPRAEMLFLQAADLGNITAMHNLGHNYKQGVFSDGTPDMVTALFWFERAAEKDDFDSTMDAAKLYEDGYTAQDGTVQIAVDALKGRALKEKGFALAQQAYEKGKATVNMLEWLGYFYQGRDDLVDVDNEKAAEVFTRAAELDSTYAMTGLADMYKDGKLGEADKAAALVWYEKAAELGHTGAMVEAALLYTERAQEGDYQMAFELLEKAGEAVDNNRLALDWLGYFYQGNGGVVTEADYEKAAEVFTRAAELDSTYAMNGLAAMYNNGKLGEADKAAALMWYEKAAKLGDTGAMIDAALLWVTTEHEDRHQKAFHWLKQAGEAVNENTLALDWLGYFYAGNYGLVEEPDYETAMAYFDRAVALGSGYSMAQIGLLYRNGEHFEKDEAQARAWFEKAVEAGYDFAQTYLDEMSAE